MGNILNCCRNPKPRKVYNILLLGLSGSGKTEIVSKITGQPRTNFASSNGVQCYKKFYEDDLINFTKIGGKEMRKIWHHYFVKTMGVIFTINVSDDINLQKSLNALYDILRHKYISGKPVLVLATKADLIYDIDIIELNETFDLEDLANRFHSHIFLAYVGLTDTTELVEGLHWLRNRIGDDYQKISNRIMFDKEDAKQENFPILHHGDNKFIRSARMAFHRMGSVITSERPYSAPSHRNSSKINFVGSARNHRVGSAINIPHHPKRVRFEKSPSN